MKFLLIAFIFLSLIASFVISDDPCNLPVHTGTCRASFVRFYFNKDTKTCERFTYGGCEGNANNFKTIEECQEACAQFMN
ncbi:hypothetical protein PVAND_017315 [Polypedilum vanderplanki]|uniref:Single Kunitz protease inhibitor n=1 Tax=Polypedilum vanderplanki TaxID=319348 RepID=A0A9J6BHW9_POLVA|nr:hypothetical protein PVAND_017315 [Polypedilum vanderplanki]